MTTRQACTILIGLSAQVLLLGGCAALDSIKPGSAEMPVNDKSGGMVSTPGNSMFENGPSMIDQDPLGRPNRAPLTEPRAPQARASASVSPR